MLHFATAILSGWMCYGKLPVSSLIHQLVFLRHRQEHLKDADQVSMVTDPQLWMLRVRRVAFTELFIACHQGTYGNRSAEDMCTGGLALRLRVQ